MSGPDICADGLGAVPEGGFFINEPYDQYGYKRDKDTHMKSRARHQNRILGGLNDCR
jgi:hypothetical protein